MILSSRKLFILIVSIRRVLRDILVLQGRLDWNFITEK